MTSKTYNGLLHTFLFSFFFFFFYKIRKLKTFKLSKKNWKTFHKICFYQQKYNNQNDILRIITHYNSKY